MKNMVYIQSGGPTSVINTSLYGAIKEAKLHRDQIDHIYGSLNGIEGMIDDRLIDIDQEDEEQTGYIAIKPDFLRKEQRLIENEMLNIIGKSGKPRFVKNILKPKTVDKYKSISGDYFGLPV